MEETLTPETTAESFSAAEQTFGILKNVLGSLEGHLARSHCCRCERDGIG